MIKRQTRFKRHGRRVSLALSSLEVHTLLGALALHPNAYGKAITEHIDKVSGYKPLNASVYVTLAGLAKKGFIKPRDGMPTHVQGGRRIRYWTLSPDGNSALAGALDAIAQLSRAAGL
jgi:DNA-binding PadR family transcriptional regulator